MYGSSDSTRLTRKALQKNGKKRQRMHADPSSFALAAIRRASGGALESLRRGLSSGALILQNRGLWLPLECRRCGWATFDTEGFALATSSYDLGINEAARAWSITGPPGRSAVLLYITHNRVSPTKTASQQYRNPSSKRTSVVITMRQSFMHTLVYLLQKDKPEAVAADLLALKGAMRSCPPGGRRTNPDEGKLQISWDALHSVASKQCASDPDIARIDKASLGKAFADAGFLLHRVHWGDVKVYVIYSPDKVDVLDKATVGIVIRAVLDKVLLGLHDGAADSGVSAENTASTSAATKPMEGKVGCMLAYLPFILLTFVGGAAPPQTPLLPSLAAFNWKLKNCLV